MNGFDAIFITVYVLPCLICLIVAFFGDDTWTWETRSLLVIISLYPILNVIATITIIKDYYDAFKNKKTKAKETIEDKYDRLTKEAYNA